MRTQAKPALQPHLRHLLGRTSGGRVFHVYPWHVHKDRHVYTRGLQQVLRKSAFRPGTRRAQAYDFVTQATVVLGELEVTVFEVSVVDSRTLRFENEFRLVLNARSRWRVARDRPA